MTTKIEWTDTTWNPIRGCSMAKGSEAGGCLNCYAARQAARGLPGLKSPTTGEDYAVMRGAGPRWTGKVELIPSKLGEPLHWQRPRRCFVNSMSDLFHEELRFEQIAAVLGVMSACPHITFQVLTKRPGVAAEFYRWLCHSSPSSAGAVFPQERINDATHRVMGGRAPGMARMLDAPWPLKNVWLGVSAEDQKTFDERWPHLRECPAAVRFWSYEPALGPVDAREALRRRPTEPPWRGGADGREYRGAIDWVIAGGESGPGARPPHPQWFRDVRDQCAAAGVPFLFKQWGEWAPWSTTPDGRPAAPGLGDLRRAARVSLDGTRDPGFPSSAERRMYRVGKRKAGRLLDGREWNEFPESPEVGR